MQKMGLFDLMDQAIADELGVDIPTYIEVIDFKCTDEECESIIHGMLSQDKEEKEKAKELFNSYLDGKQ